MSKYIDADKLIAQIKELRSESCISEADDYYEYAKSEILDLITSLQQEQLSDYDRALLEVKAKVDKLYDEASIGLNEYDSGLYNGIAETCMKLRGFINARLSSEQTQLPGVEENGIPGKDFIPVEWVDTCEKYGKWKIVKQEQPEVDLEKFTEKIKTFQERYKYPEIVSIKGAMAFMARMFYQYPNVARQWYDSLPKATMD